MTATVIDAQGLVGRLRASFRARRTRPVAWRRTQLQALRAMLTEQADDFLAALQADLGKSATQARGPELDFVTNEIDHTLANLDAWLAEEPAEVPARLAGGNARVVREPLGVVLVIGPWNYPVHLVFAPLVGAIAAGNCVVVKPSEVSAATSAAIARHLPRYLDPEAFAVAEGGVAETTALLAEHFDHIFYTGNGAVGRIVMAAAARHLTPVVLELGGKSPTVIEPGTDYAAAAGVIAYGRFSNAGQTCVAPDYLLAIGSAADEIQPFLAGAVQAMYGEDPQASSEYGRIINERHFDRLRPLLDDGRPVFGGQSDRADRYIAPTLLDDVDPGSAVMSAEIFGPILPIIRVPDLDAAIAFINERDKPLALYGFTASERSKRRLQDETSSGGLVFGAALVQLAVPDLPFGGVGESGLGRYHGKYSIDTFSHLKAVLDTSVGAKS
ncbi:MAG TPA: aldehyde dehydrogenase family protein [Pseudonocardiaceae bacterium]|jgi:aldehyde dehydrogenase (NAD+)